MADYLLGIDLGTTACKTGIFDTNGNRVALASKEYPLYTPYPSYAEQDAEDWWNAVVETLKEVLDASGIDPRDIKGIGAGGPCYGHVFLDSSGNVLRRAITFQDRRATKQAQWIMKNLNDQKRFELTGNPLPVDSSFSPCRLLWIKENEPELLDKTDKVLQPKDFINFKLTGSFATDSLSAAGLVNLIDNKYYKEYFDLLGIPMNIVPDVHPSFDIIGKITREVSNITDLCQGTPVVTGWMDGTCCCIGSGMVEHGRANDMCGTADNIGVMSKNFAFDEGLMVGPIFDLFFIGGGTSAGGYSLKWFRNTFGQIEAQIANQIPGLSSYTLLDMEADSVVPGADNLIFLPYIIGERSPIWDPNAKGLFIGITERHTKAHFVRAIMEGVAYSIRHILEIAEKASKIKVEEIRVAGGGGKSEVWNQIKADVLGRRFLKLKELEVGALGGAMLAGMGTNIFKDQREASELMVHVEKIIEPNMENHRRYDKLFNIYKGLYPLLKNTFLKLTENEDSLKEE
ncbi:MAG: FGGY-family carbohydrate kinase [Deltaproteobacteria bacterium]|nr:FGGY-family carbohydrate kinase [Deltaproteobacteria bacterium]